MSGALLPWDQDTFLDLHARRQFPQSLRRRPRDPKPRAKHPERGLARTWNGRGPRSFLEWLVLSGSGFSVAPSRLE